MAKRKRNTKILKILEKILIFKLPAEKMKKYPKTKNKPIERKNKNENKPQILFKTKQSKMLMK